MTEQTGPPPRPEPVSALEPWPDTVRWQPVSPNLVWVELISFGSLVLTVAGVAWFLVARRARRPGS